MAGYSGLKWGAVSITGNFRENNEDRCHVDPGARFFLVAALLSWVFLAVAFIRFVLRNGENDPRQQSYFSDPPHDQDPNSLNFSGAGPGFQGFGMYAGGVRIAQDPLDDD